MKKFSIALTLLAIWGLITYSNLLGQELSPEMEISGGDTPDMDIDPMTGKVYVLSMYNGVTITILDSEGNILSQESVPGAEKDLGGSRFGATVAVDSKGYPHVCYRLYNGDDYYTAYYIRKTASGWGNSIKLWQRAYRGYMIRIDVDENDVAHIAQGFAYEGDIFGHLKYFRVIDNSIDKEEILGTSYNYVYRADDRVEIETFPGGYIHILSSFPDPTGKVFYFYSTDRGNTFSAGENIREASNKSRSGSAELQIDKNGHLHLCYGESEDALRNNKPSVHYARIQEFNKVNDVVATLEGELVPWPEATKIGLGSIGCSDNGQNLVLAYVKEPGETLSAIHSTDGGNSWSSPTRLAEHCGSNEGRNKQIVRGNGNIFYLIYPHSWKVWLRIISFETNQSPSAVAGGPYTGKEGSPITFNAANSVDPDGMIVQYQWDWNNDGIYDTITTSAIIQYTYKDDYSGAIRLKVIDNENAKDEDQTTVTVANVAPTANAHGPYAGEKNKNITLTGSATDPGTLDTFIYEWDLDNDGNFESVGQTVIANYSSGGSHKVTLKVTDDDGGVGTDVTSVNINNLPPVVSSIPDQQINEGSSFTSIPLDNYITDPDNSDSEISWEAHGQQNIVVSIINRIAYPKSVDENWTGTNYITFVASDPGGLKDSTRTKFTVINVNDPPVLRQIPGQTKDEGQTFDPINLDDYVEDPDHDKSVLTWQVEGNQELTLNWNHRILQVLTPHSDWFGSEVLTFTVTDPAGASDTTSAKFKINSINDPPVITGLMGQTIQADQQFSPIHLDDFVHDVDHPDNQLRWRYFGNVKLQIKIDEARIATITKPSLPNWTGSETITFVVTDGSLSDSATAIFTVIKGDYPPVISSIPGQTKGENQPFQPIYLDGYVTDPDHRDDELSWFLTGYEDLLVNWANRIVTIAVPDSEWSGTEIINFMVTDPSGLSDTASASFTVIPINDPPEFSKLPNYTIQEDDTLKISVTYLKALVIDPDNEPSDFQFHVSKLVNLDWFIDSRTNTIDLFARALNWYGTETIQITVTDGSGGSASQPTTITVQPVPDAPLPFTVISPNHYNFTSIPSAITFTWHRAIDPDVGDVVTYELSLSDQDNFSHVFDSYRNISDTTFIYKPSQPLWDGTFYWRVKATENHNLFTYSNVGKFSINRTAVSTDSETGRPKDYGLNQNYPNPFNPKTCLTFQLPKSGQVEIRIINSLGQHIRTLESGEKSAGVHNIHWDGLDDHGLPVSSGIYVCQMKAGDRVLSRKMLLVQ